MEGVFQLRIKTSSRRMASISECMGYAHLRAESRDEHDHHFTSVLTATNGDFRMSWDSVNGREYTVKRSFDLEDWDDVGTYTGDGLGKLFEESIDVNLNPSVFYHMEIAHP